MGKIPGCRSCSAELGQLVAELASRGFAVVVVLDALGWDFVAALPSVVAMERTEFVAERLAVGGIVVVKLANVHSFYLMVLLRVGIVVELVAVVCIDRKMLLSLQLEKPGFDPPHSV
jgi:hypothetical protein